MPLWIKDKLFQKHSLIKKLSFILDKQNGTNGYFFLNIIYRMLQVLSTHHRLRALQFLLWMVLVNGQQLQTLLTREMI